MNEVWTAVLSEGKVSLHQIEDDTQRDLKFPENQSDPPILQIALSDMFLLMVDASGKLSYYFIEDQAFILEH
jgi:hypothetical protein